MLGLEIRFRVWICSQYLHFQISELKIFSRKVCFTEKLFLSAYVSKIHYSGSSGAEQHLFQDSVIQKRITLIIKSLFSLFCLPSMSHLKSQFSGPTPVTVKINRKGFLWIRQDSQPAGATVCSWLSSLGHIWKPHHSQNQNSTRSRSKSICFLLGKASVKILLTEMLICFGENVLAKCRVCYRINATIPSERRTVFQL